MPRNPVAAAAPGLPKLTPDPLAGLIGEYRHQSRIFEARAETEAWDGLSAETYDPALFQLIEKPPLPTTMEGAAIGIEFALGELAVAGDCPAAAGSVLRACIAYLRGGASA